MAQVFEIPTGKPDSNQPTVLLEPSSGFFANFRIAGPGRHRPICRVDSKNMGPRPACCKRANAPRMCRAKRLIPGAGDRKVNQSCPV
jgi:hypothetical protein